MSKVTAETIGWTDEQDAELIRLAGTMPPKEIAKQTRRNFRQMQVRAHILGVSLAYNRTYTQWTTGEDARLLRFLEDKLTDEDCVEISEITGIYEISADKLRHQDVADWLDKTVASLRGRIAKFKKEGTFK